jgi:Ca2+:H+ antiporter
MSGLDVLRKFRWTTVVPLVALIVLVPTWSTKPAGPVLALVALFLAGAVPAAVYHAEVIAHRVGDPFGSLVLAVAVGVIIAILVRSPETVSAVRNASRGRVRTSFNLAFGSAMASIGLTIPAIAVASIWLDGPLVLGLGATQMALLAVTAVVGALTVLPGRATLQEAGVHLVIAAAFVFLAANP